MSLQLFNFCVLLPMGCVFNSADMCARFCIRVCSRLGALLCALEDVSESLASRVVKPNCLHMWRIFKCLE